MMSSTPAIGIDLGTANCCVAVFQDGCVDIIPNDHGNRTTPSYVAFTDTGRLIGDEAKNQIEDNPLNTVYDFKQLIGRRFDDSSLQNELKYSFTTFNVMNDKMRPKIMVEHKKKTQTFCPEEILSMLLRKLKRDAEAFLGKSVTNAVITVPGYFSNHQRQIVMDCAAIARLNVLRIVNDSTIAALAYGFMDKDKIFVYDRNVLIFDLGSHNCNVSIVTIDNGIYEVKATNSERNLGGSSFDTRLVNHFVQKFHNKYRRDISLNKGSLVRLRVACEQAKMELSSSIEAKIEIESLFDGIDFNSSITRVEFEEICADLFSDILELILKCLNDSRIRVSPIHEIVAIGGSMRIPKIRSLWKCLFKYGRNMKTSFAHEELVAYGAALQAAILNGDKSKTVQNQVLLNLTPHSLGFELPDGTMKIVIKRNTIIPTSKTVIISTFENNQTRMPIQVCEVENGRINNILGKIIICDIPPKPKGVPQIVVTFDSSEYTYLKANATLKIESTIIRQFDMLPNDSNRFGPDEIESMIKKADALDDEDRIAARDSLKSFTQQVVLAVEDVTRKANAQINEMNKWMEQNVDCADKNDFKLKRRTLERFCSELGEVLKQLK